MKGLLVKEFYQFKRLDMLSTAFIYIMFILMGITSPLFIIVFFPVISAILSTRSIAYDEQYKWNRFSIALPYKRSSIVSAKYIYHLLLLAISEIIIILCTIINTLRGNDLDTNIFISGIMSGIISNFIMSSVTYPLYFRFGTNKAKIIGILIGVTMGASAGTISTILTDEGIAFLSEINNTVLLLFTVGAFLLFMLSWALSIYVYNKKDL